MGYDDDAMEYAVSTAFVPCKVVKLSFVVVTKADFSIVQEGIQPTLTFILLP